MTPDQHIKSLQKVINETVSNYNGTIMGGLASNALSLLRTRVQETGTDAKGQKYKGYSTKPMLANCSSMILSACSKVAGSKDKRRELQWRTVNGHKLFILPGGYKQWRELHGRQTNHVDFMVTGRMWDDVSVISKQSDHQNGIAIIGARLDDQKKKLEGNTKRKGDILDLNQQEQDILKNQYGLSVLQIFKDNGL